MTHEAGWAHAPGALRAPGVAARARPTPTRWSATSGRRPRTSDDGVLTVGGVRLTDLVGRARLPGVRPRRGRLPGPGPGVPRGVRRLRRLLRRQGVPLHRDRALGRRGGAQPRRLHRRRARRSPSGPGFDTARIGFHGNNKSDAELERAVDPGRRPGRSSTPSTRSSGWPRSPSGSAAPRRCMVRVTAGVEAHTHEYIATAHEDQKFGFSITNGAGLRRRTPGAGGAAPASCSGCTPTSAARSSTPRGSRSRPAGCSPCTPGSSDELGVDAARARPRRRLRHRLHDPGRPGRAQSSSPPR